MDRNSPKPGAEAAGGTPVGQVLLGHEVCFRIGPERGPERAGIRWDAPLPSPPARVGSGKAQKHLQKKDRFLFSKVKEAAGALPTFKGESAAAKVGFCGCIPEHSTPPGLHLLVVRSSASLPSALPCLPLMLPVCLPPCPASGGSPGTWSWHHAFSQPSGQPGFPELPGEREQDEGHSSGFWDGAAPGLGGEGCKQRWLVG